MPHIIAIDGGGTKTNAVLADDTGSIYAYSSTGPTNPNTISGEVLEQTLQLLFADLKKQASESFAKVTTVFAGIAGASSPQNAKQLQFSLEQISPANASITVEIDTVNALYSGTYGKPGMVQIAGTGAISFGINQHRHRERVGGWGYLLGDEGSGYAIGQQGIIAVLKAYDGRGEQTILTKIVSQYFGVARGEEIIQHVYSSAIPKVEIAAAAKLVFQAYKQNDPVAKEIIHRASRELCWSVRTLYRKLFSGEKTILVLCGGIFSESSIIPQHIKKDLFQSHQQIEMVLPKLPPVGGAVIGAYLACEITITNKVIENLIENFKKRIHTI
ncbi:BadF/BadG/BcrA/BcrD ATPase family protein [Lentibacillus sp. N15]|uniref:N-acetylglucosamine kinase n=1 Tax=Lentibacillus songyuanensis TaxID=3136161 RepID=UPI0031BADCC4